MWKMTHQSQPTNTALFEEISNTLTHFLSQSEKSFADVSLLEKDFSLADSLAKKLRSQFDTFCVLGIGGSSLGAQAVIEALEPQLLEEKKVVFFDNVDAKSFFRKLEQVKNPQKTLWILISKSGGTIETLAQADFIREYLFDQFQIHLHQKAVVITEPKTNALFNWAQQNQVPILPVPLTIGGRFSVLTPVGTFLFSLLNLPVSDLLKGARQAVADTKWVAEVSTQFAMSFSRNETATYFFSYCDDLRYWGQWLQQLWAESLGKKTNKMGQEAPLMSLPYACRGATDQHSVLQQVSEGTQKKMTCFLRVLESENFGPSLKEQKLLTSDNLTQKSLGNLLSAEASAIQKALNEAQIATITLQTEKLSGESLGYLLMSFQLVVATLGLFHQIDPFNQPGVERGKVLTRLILSKSESAL
jgi:glucose-6-phosphate isomerase